LVIPNWCVKKESAPLSYLASWLVIIVTSGSVGFRDLTTLLVAHIKPIWRRTIILSTNNKLDNKELMAVLASFEVPFRHLREVTLENHERSHSGWGNSMPTTERWNCRI
jgi:hypothetical protein